MFRLWTVIYFVFLLAFCPCSFSSRPAIIRVLLLQLQVPNLLSLFPTAFEIELDIFKVKISIHIYPARLLFLLYDLFIDCNVPLTPLLSFNKFYISHVLWLLYCWPIATVPAAYIIRDLIIQPFCWRVGRGERLDPEKKVKRTTGLSSFATYSTLIGYLFLICKDAQVHLAWLLMLNYFNCTTCHFVLFYLAFP